MMVPKVFDSKCSLMRYRNLLFTEAGHSVPFFLLSGKPSDLIFSGGVVQIRKFLSLAGSLNIGFTLISESRFNKTEVVLPE